MHKKSYFWNNFRGVLILLIVFGNFLYPYAQNLKGSSANTIYTFLNMFCMPAFVFGYGYLSKPKRARGKNALMTLLVCYLVVNTAMMLLLYFAKGATFRLLYPADCYGFVLSLIVWRIFAEPLSRVKGIIPIMAAVTLMMGFWEDFTTLFSLRMTVAYFVFFLLGYRFERERFKRMIRARSVKKYIIALAITAVGLIGVYFIVTHFTFTARILQMGTYKRGLHVIYRACMMGVSLAGIIMMMLLMPNANISVLTTFGRNSMLIYLGHGFAVLLFTALFPYRGYTDSYITYAAIATIVTCMIFGDNRLNRAVNDCAGKAALQLVSGEKKGKYLQTGILLVLLAIMVIFPVLERI